VDPFAWLDAIFVGDGGGYSSAGQGGPRLDQGFSPVAGWMVGQAFAGAGPVGQYMGMLYGLPGTGIPSVDWDAGYGDVLDFTGHPDYSDFGGAGRADPNDPYAYTGPQTVDAPDQAPSQPRESRSLDVLDREQSGTSAPPGPIDEVVVFGSPPDRPSHDWFENYIPSPPNTFSGGEIQFRWRPPQMRAPRRPVVRKPLPPLPPLPPEQQPDLVDGGPYFENDVSPFSVPVIEQVPIPWMSDAATPQQFLPWGAWDRPENVPSPRWERSGAGRIEAVSTVPTERSFWNRGGTGLAAGAVTAAVGVAVLFWWNPVGWVAGASAALAIAGGVAATTASAVELSASYAGATTPMQDAETNRAVAATLAYSSVGGVLGGVAGTVLADDAQVGFEEGAFWGGLIEGTAGLASSLPGALRAVPELWTAALPWAKSLLLTPLSFSLAAGFGGGSVRSLARVFAARGRIASRIRTVEYLGTTPLMEREANWARYQVFATGTRDEGVYRITYTNGQQRTVSADRGSPFGRRILEAKEGDLGQMWKPEREAHIMSQIRNYLDITTVTGGRVGYLVSTELGASRLLDRFGREFPTQMKSGQLWIDWVSWQR